MSPPTRGLFGNLTPSTRPRARRPKSEAERQRIRERRVVRERDRQASGPIYQFLHQVSQERDRVREEWTSDDAVPLESINTKCYTAVRQSWKSRGIWIDQWDVLPGDRWMHESPLGPTVAGFALGYSLENGQPRMSDESQPLPSEQLPPSTAFGGENDQLGFRTQPEPEPTDSRNLDLDESRRRNVGPEPPASHLHQSTADRPHVSAQRSRREVSNVRSVFLPTLHTSKITKAPKRKQSRRSRRLGGPSHPPADPQPSKVATTTAGPRTSDAKAAPRQSQRLKEQKTKKDAGRMRAATKQPRVPQDRARSDRTAPKASKPQGITKATRRKATKTR